jgi:ribulose-5-phosphate 4-epimerase/fuculose-1-phosphate aldolase
MQMRVVDSALSNVRNQVTAEEWATRVDLAACYRLVAHFGWDDLVFTHISARVPGTHDFLINPYGFMFEEITASSLVRVDLEGKKTLETPYDINPAGYTIHSAIHAARDDAGCVLHLHTMAGVAVSAQKAGLLPISQQSTLRNHGLLTVGKNVGDAFLSMYTLQRACEVQLLAQGNGAELIDIPQSVMDTVPEFSRMVTKGAGSALVWPALLRKMDRLDTSFRN